MNIYELYPPFIYIPEECNFADQWEEFCLRLLKLDNKTNDIERRKAPESGIDLYYNEKKIAYQCKCNLYGTRVNVTKIIDSLKVALSQRDEEKWTKYIICTNENLTGSQIKKIRSICKDVEFKGKSYWVGLCNDYSQYINKYFRALVPLDKELIRYTDYMYNPKLFEISKKLQGNSNEHINFVSVKHDKIYKIPISLKISVHELIYLLREMLNLNNVYKETNGNYFAREQIIFNEEILYYNEKDNRSLEEIGLKNEEVIFYAINICNKAINFDKSDLQLLYNENNININEIEKNIFIKFDSKINDSKRG